MHYQPINFWSNSEGQDSRSRDSNYAGLQRFDLPCRFREWMPSLTMGQGFWMFSVGVFVHRSSTLVLWLLRRFPFVRTKETVWRDYVRTSGSSRCESAISQLLGSLELADSRGGYQHPDSQSKRDYFVHAERRSKHDNSGPWAWNCCATAWVFETICKLPVNHPNYTAKGESRCIWRYQNQSVMFQWVTPLWGSQTVLAGTSFPSLIWVTLPLESLTRARLVACWALASCLVLRPALTCLILSSMFTLYTSAVYRTFLNHLIVVCLNCAETILKVPQWVRSLDVLSVNVWQCVCLFLVFSARYQCCKTPGGCGGWKAGIPPDHARWCLFCIHKEFAFLPEELALIWKSDLWVGTQLWITITGL